MTKIISWNVNGLRAVEKKGFLEYLRAVAPDILCLQETKAEEGQLSPEVRFPVGYHAYFNSAEKKGYSGVAIYSKEKPLKVETTFTDSKFNTEGRILWAHYKDLIVLNLYFPNGQQSDERLQYKLAFNDHLIEELKAYTGKKIVVCGDYNTAHTPIDLANPKANENYSGFLPIERAWIDRFIEFGYTDVWRKFNPETIKYSWWTYRMGARARNIGWRIDYHFVSPSLLPQVKTAWIDNDTTGSDHCPVGLELS